MPRCAVRRRSRRTPISRALEHREAHCRRQAEPADDDHELRHDAQERRDHEQVIFHHATALLHELTRLDREAAVFELRAQSLDELQLGCGAVDCALDDGAIHAAIPDHTG
jgi:hypothetical protein